MKDLLNIFFPKRSQSNRRSTAPVSQQQSDGKRVIIVHLNGGNDGLNTVVPYDNDSYYRKRPNIAIDKSSVLQIETLYGFHPSLTGFERLYKAGLMTVVNGVGYDNPNRSHFAATDIWHTALLNPRPKDIGWIGTYLDSISAQADHPFKAMEMSDLLSRVMKGQYQDGIAVNDVRSYIKELSHREMRYIPKVEVSNLRKNPHLNLIYGQIAEGAQYVDNFKHHIPEKKVLGEFANTEFGRDCHSVCELINAGTDTDIFYLTHGNFDTHVGQKGTHASLLKDLGDNMLTMVKTLKTLNALDDTVIMVYSEFGRRVEENGGKGTDHGTANQVYFISNQLTSPGLYNDQVDLEDLIDGDLRHSIDFRRTYRELLDWLNVSPREILGADYERLRIFKNTGDSLLS